MSEIVSFQAVISGRVQGVGFRYFARQRAEARGVAGFVRNLPDGSVEVHAEGPKEALDEFEKDLRVGPTFGRVEDTRLTAIRPRGFEAFEIR